MLHKREKAVACILIAALVVMNIALFSSAQEKEYEYVIEKVRGETSDYIADMIDLMIYGDEVKNPYYVGARFPSQEKYLTLSDVERGYNVYLASSQCTGFANWMFWKLFGATTYGTTPTGRTIDISNVGYIPKGKMTVAKLQEVFKKAKTGAHVRVASRVIGKQHSLVYLTTDVNNTGFYFLDAKMSGGSYKVFFGFYKFSDFVNKYGAYILNGIFNPAIYPSYDYTELLTVQDLKYPNVIERGKSYTLEGYVTSESKIEEVKINVQNSSGNTSFTYKTNPNTKIWNIINADKWLGFSRLSQGNYTLDITAHNEDGEDIRVTREFSVRSNIVSTTKTETIERYVEPIVVEPETTETQTTPQTIPETIPETLETQTDFEVDIEKDEEHSPEETPDVTFLNHFMRMSIPLSKPSVIYHKYKLQNLFSEFRLNT